MTANRKQDQASAAYDAGAEAERLWHDIWDTIEDDVPTFATGPYPPYARVKEFETRIRDELRRAFAAGAGSRSA